MKKSFVYLSVILALSMLLCGCGDNVTGTDDSMSMPMISDSPAAVPSSAPSDNSTTKAEPMPSISPDIADDGIVRDRDGIIEDRDTGSSTVTSDPAETQSSSPAADTGK